MEKICVNAPYIYGQTDTVFIYGMFRYLGRGIDHRLALSFFLKGNLFWVS